MHGLPRTPIVCRSCQARGRRKRREKKKKKKKEEEEEGKYITSCGQTTSLLAMLVPSAQVALHSRVVAHIKLKKSCATGQDQKLPLT